MSIPLGTHSTHPLVTFSHKLMHHVTKLKLSPTSFLHLTLSSLASSVIRSQSNRAPVGCVEKLDSEPNHQVVQSFFGIYNAVIQQIIELGDQFIHIINRIQQNN